MRGSRTLSTRYRLDPDLFIIWTSPNWDRFARENGAPELAGGAVVGQPLLSFVEGAETRALYEKMLFRVRETGMELSLPFRCDSPDVKRFMSLRIKRPENALVELSAELLREEPRPHVDLLDAACPRAGDPVPICGFCKRVPSRAGEWLEVEEVRVPGAPADAAPLPPLQHAVCPTCRETARAAAG